MATYYWVAPGVRNWNDIVDAWSLSSGGVPVAAYPQASDTAIFDANGVNNCTITANISITSLSMTSGFVAQLRTDNLAAYSHSITGDCFFGCSAAGSIKLGNSAQTWNIGGNFQSSNVLGTWVPGDSKVIMTGTSVGIKTGLSGAAYFYDLEINGTVTCNTDSCRWHHDFTVKANKTFTCGSRLVSWNIGAVAQSKIYLESGATIDSTGQIWWYAPGVGGVASMASTARITGGSMYILYPVGTGVWDFGTTYGWESNVFIYGPVGAGSFTFPNTTCKITGFIQFYIANWYTGSSLTVASGGSSCDVLVSGNFQFKSDAPNTGDINLNNSAGNKWSIGGNFYTSWSGSGELHWNDNAETVEFNGTLSTYFETGDFTTAHFNTVEINKTGAGGIYLINDDLDCQDFDLKDGSFDMNEFDLYVDRHFYARSGTGWTNSSTSVIYLDNTLVANAMAIPTVDPVDMTRNTGGVTLTGNFNARTLTLSGNGYWDAAGYSVTITTDGIVKGSGTLTMGSGIWTLNGTTTVTGAIIFGTQLVFASSCTFIYSSGVTFHSITVNTGISVTCNVGAATNLQLEGGTLDIYGSLNFGPGNCRTANNTHTRVRSGGTLTSNGTDTTGFWCQQINSGYGIIQNDGTWTPKTTRFYKCNSGTRWSDGTYAGDIIYITSDAGNDCYVKPDAGTFNINSTLNFYNTGAGIQHLDMTNDPTFNFLYHCQYGGGATPSNVDWTVSNETLEFVGTANQTYEWGHEVGNIIIDNSGSGTGLNVSGTYAAVDCKSLTATDGGFFTNGTDVDVAEDVILDCDAVTTSSGGTWTMGGNFDWQDVVTWSLHILTTFVMTGSNKYLLGINSHGLPNLTIDTSASSYIHASTTSSVDVLYLTLVKSGAALTCDYTLRIGSVSGDLQLANTATVTGTGTIRFLGMGVGKGLIFDTSLYTYSVYNTVFYDPQTTSLIPPGDYTGSEVKIWANTANSTWLPLTGTYNLPALRFTTSNSPDYYTLLVDNTTTQPVFNISGEFNIGPAQDAVITVNNTNASVINYNCSETVNFLHHSIVWTKGSGTITCNGSGSHTFDTYNHSIEDIVFGGSGTYTLEGSGSILKPDSFTLSGGIFDANGVDVTTPGDIDMSANGTTIIMGTGSTWTCNGNVDISGPSTFTKETGKLVMGGTAKTIKGRGATDLNTLYSYEVANTATISQIDKSLIINGGDLVVNGTFTATPGLWAYGTCQTTISANGLLDGIYLAFRGATSGGGLIDYSGNIDTDYLYLRSLTNTAAEIPAGDYNSANFYIYAYDLGDCDVTFGSGDFYTNGFFYLRSNLATDQDINIHNDTNDPNFFLGGDFYTDTANGNVTNWTKGAGLITFDNSDCSIEMASVVGTLDAISISIASTLTLESDLNAQSLLVATGNFDANDFDVTLVDFFRMNVSTITNAGSGTWDVGGDWDTVAATASGSFVAENGEIQLTGSGTIECYCVSWVNSFHKLTISGTYTMPEGSNHITIAEGTGGWLKITSGGTFTLADTIHDVWLANYGGTDLIIESSGELVIGSTSNVYHWNPASGYGIPTNNGTISGTGVLRLYEFDATNPIDAGNYGYLYAYAATVSGIARFEAGTYNFTASLQVGATGSANMTLDLGTNNPTVNVDGVVMISATSSGTAIITRAGATTNWNIGGDFAHNGGGPKTYTKGSAGSSITLDGTSTQNLNFSAGDIEDLIVNKSAGAAILVSNVGMETLTGTNGDFDANDYDITSSDVDWNADDLDMGTGTWTANGNFNVDDADVTISAASATLVMTGTSKTLGWRSASTLGTLDVDTGASITWVISVGDANGYITNVNVDGTLNITAGDTLTCTEQLDINATGSLGDGNGTLYIQGTTAAHGITTYDGSLDVDTLYIHPLAAAATDLLALAGTYTATTAIWFIDSAASDYSIELGAGPYIFDSPVTGLQTTSTGKMTVDNTANADITFVGGFEDDTTSTGVREWLKGTGLAKFTGAGSHNIEWNMGTVEDIEIDAAGTYTITDDLVTDSFLGTAGVIDFNGQTLETIGDFTINSANSTGFSVVADADAMNAADITVGNDFYLSNLTLNATNTWTLDVQGASAFAFDVSVRYSNANAGTTIDATAPGNTDLGVNYNWDFGALPGEPVSSIHSLSVHCFPWTRLTNRHVRGFRRR